MDNEYDIRKASDKKKEAVVHQWLYNNLWHRFPTYQSNDSDAERQKRGVDCEFTGKDGFHYICDEKAATREDYINPGHTFMSEYGTEKTARRLPTFCLELSMRTKIKNTNIWKRFVGWFLKEDEENNSFCFVWIDRTTPGKENIESVEDIKEAEVIIVRKDRIWEYLNSLGWTKEKMSEEVEYILNNPEEFDKSKMVNGLKFSCPKWLIKKEFPVNVLVTRETYRAISDYNNVFKFD